MTSPTIKTIFIRSLLLLSMLPNITTAQICKTEVPDLHPNSRYVNHGDGTVTDKETGLMWKQCFEGKSGINTCNIGFIITLSDWQVALESAAASTFAGHSDWRVPNLPELTSLITQNCYKPAINIALFPDDPNVPAWSSSPDITNSKNARYINFKTSGSNRIDRTFILPLRLVRSGQ